VTAAIDRDTLTMMGARVGPAALSRHDGVSAFSTLTTIGESPLEKNYRCVSHAIYFPAFSPTIRSDGSIYWRLR
ncbi:MAG: hypothetical protein ACK5QX_00740, partial [bacterium]